jgi:hypothetical protein
MHAPPLRHTRLLRDAILYAPRNSFHCATQHSTPHSSCLMGPCASLPATLAGKRMLCGALRVLHDRFCISALEPDPAVCV